MFIDTSISETIREARPIDELVISSDLDTFSVNSSLHSLQRNNTLDGVHVSCCEQMEFMFTCFRICKYRRDTFQSNLSFSYEHEIKYQNSINGINGKRQQQFN